MNSFRQERGQGERFFLRLLFNNQLKISILKGVFWGGKPLVSLAKGRMNYDNILAWRRRRTNAVYVSLQSSGGSANAKMFLLSVSSGKPKGKNKTHMGKSSVSIVRSSTTHKQQVL